MSRTSQRSSDRRAADNALIVGATLARIHEQRESAITTLVQECERLRAERDEQADLVVRYFNRETALDRQATEAMAIARELLTEVAEVIGNDAWQVFDARLSALGG